MRTFASVDELAASVSEDIGVSSWILVDQKRIDTFAEATGDFQWLHVDPERAATGPFGGTIAHGFLTLSLLAAMIPEVFTIEGNPTAVNYGLDKVRFLRPVPSGSRVRGTISLASAENTSQGLRAVLKVTIEIDGDDKPACIAEMISFYLSPGTAT